MGSDNKKDKKVDMKKDLKDIQTSMSSMDKLITQVEGVRSDKEDLFGAMGESSFDEFADKESDVKTPNSKGDVKESGLKESTDMIDEPIVDNLVDNKVIEKAGEYAG